MNDNQGSSMRERRAEGAGRQNDDLSAILKSMREIREESESVIARAKRFLDSQREKTGGLTQ